MAKWHDILSVNARNRLFLKYNSKKGREIADSKILTKKVMKKAGLPVPELYKVFTKLDEVDEYGWSKLEGNFVIKPTHGYAGEGVLMIRKKGNQPGEWVLMDNSVATTEDLRFHIADILAGRYSLKDTPDQAFVEERIKIHSIFKKYTYQGTPDIRVVVFNQIPLMAMLRLPTPESKGRANLHQGAIGAGIDVATGITTHGVHYNRPIKTIPHTGKKINGLKLPFWDELLLLAVKAQEVVPQLGYMGIDFVLDKTHGPTILELNARPGLGIQICNMAGLHSRLNRVLGLEVRGAEHGVRIAKSLFAERFADRVTAEKGIKMLKVLEPVKIRYDKNKWHEIMAKIDTGAYRSSIDRDLARRLNLYKEENILYARHYRSSMGIRKKRNVVELTIRLGGRRFKTSANVVKRTHLNTPLLIGRRDLAGFLVKPEPVVTGEAEKIRIINEKQEAKDGKG